jgi:glycerophosphoryl diester phosphodiesterase
MVTRDFPAPSFPLVVAHRGASADYPENTLESFRGAVEAGADAVELDIRLTADGIPVVMHDADVSRCTDGSGFVHDMELAELKKLDASAGRGPRTEVPRLAEVLELVSGKAGVNLEIKNIPGEPSYDSPREATVRAALEEVEAASFSGSVLVSSFNWITIERSLELAPDTPTGFLTLAAIDPEAALVYARGAGHAFVLPHAVALFHAGERFVRKAHEAGLRVGTWTVDEPEALTRFFSWGVDAVATNDPEGAVRVRSAA